MDGDENDILSTNKFIASPELQQELSSDASEEFKKYYEAEMRKASESKLRDSIDRVSLQNIQLDEESDANSLLNTNKFTGLDVASANSEILPTELKRYTKEVITLVNVDSRDRDKNLYPKPSAFKIFLGKTFYNVKTIKLSRIEFPNTDAVINTSNNYVYWRNGEDIDDDIIDNITQTYPIYKSAFRIGSYIASSLQTEMKNKMSLVKRRNKVGSDFHYFDVNLDIDTDVVTFTSLFLKSLDVDPISVIKGAGVVTVDTSTAHGFKNNDTIYLVGAKTIAGIPASLINTSHQITLIGSYPTSTQFQFEVNIKASETAIGGGNTVSTGRLAPFQLLFGEYNNTIAQNLGFPLENSSERINTYIKSVEKLYLAKITTSTPHGFTNSYTYINTPCLISGTGIIGLDGNRVIYKVEDATTFFVSLNAEIHGSASGGVVTFGGSSVSISSASNYITETVLITTFSQHNMEFADINRFVSIFNSITTPSIDGTYRLFGLISPTKFIIQTSILVGGGSNVNIEGNGGSIPFHDPLQSRTIEITGISTGSVTTFEAVGHSLQVGQKIKLYNIRTLPSITERNNSTYTIWSIPDSDHFTIDFSTSSYDPQSLDAAYIGTDILTITFPNHGFNSVTSIINGSISGKIDIQTYLPHGLVTGDKVRVMNTNSVPSIDDSYDVVVTSSDTFEIDYGSVLTTSGDSGIIGMSHEFSLYGAKDIGGINQDFINNKKQTVLQIIDENTFTFKVLAFASKTERGGGTNVYISSLLHGFNGVQNNTKSSVLNRSINLEGENYAFICCPQLATMMNTGNVKDIFARVTLDQSPGNMVFNFLSNPKEFDTVPLDKLDELQFSVVNYNNSFYEFNDLDYSFVLEITEVIDTVDDFGFSSKRGVNNRGV
uniref:Uncharacterized protein n=1 Tax=viral metagenome TaxID=1070528 RepID=A0A6C0E4A2_9ZZZZ